jgi:hypothetical protein
VTAPAALSMESLHPNRIRFGAARLPVSSSCAVGVVSLIEIASEMQYLPWRQGTFMVSRMAKGVGQLRPEAMYEIQHS